MTLPRLATNSTMSTGSTSSPRPRAVCFADMSALAFIPKDPVESKWYSAQEQRRFRQELVQDVADASRALQDHEAAASLSSELSFRILGIESCLAPAARDLWNARRAHIRAVLSEQRLQAGRGGAGRDVRRLSAVAERSSSWARGRAQGLANRYYSELS